MKTIDETISLLTLEEKVALVAGYKFMRTNPVPRLDIPSLKTSDGPHGLRAQPDGGDNGITNSLPATCFPTASCSANSWRPELLRQMGNAMAEEARYYDVDVILGPGVNVKRNPRCGRNFEYFSEDPFLSGRLGAAEVTGIQERGIGTSLKHFAFNNSENYRFMGDSVVDERAAREIYLRQFEYIVKTAKPETVMAAYNGANGTYCSENAWLLNDILRKEWGFQGLVMSDWGATHNRIQGVEAGLDLEMPGDTDICRKWLFDAVSNGTMKAEALDKAVTNVLALVERHQNKEAKQEVDWAAHHELAKKIALEGAVLLKNESSLPLGKDEKILIVGELFEKMRYQGSGSSLINPHDHCSAKEAFDANHASYEFAKGYKENTPMVDEALMEEALSKASKAEKIIVFAGLTDDFETEGSDRENLRMPENQIALIDALIKLNKKIVVVLFGGSVVELPFFDKVDSILNMFLPGQNGGAATFDLLYGNACPSGRLAETWPLAYEDVPFGNDFALSAQEIYKESIYVGYRYYLSADKAVRFPFGYGLSYTSFEYGNLSVKQNEKELIAEVDVKNVGERAGAEVVQLYVASPKESLHKPIRELKGFAKIELSPGETKTVTIQINKEELKCWDIHRSRFVLEEGDYEIQVGKNSRDIVLSEKIAIKGEIIDKTLQKPYEMLDFAKMSNQQFEQAWGMKIPPARPKKPITLESRLSDINATFMGKMLYGALQSVAKKDEKAAKKMPEGTEKENRLKGARLLKIILDSNSIISLSMSSSGQFSYPIAEGFVEMANGHLIRGIKKMTKKLKAPALPINSKEGK